MRETAPRPPRRLFLASLVAALAAGGATGLATIGAVSAPETELFRFARGINLAPGEDERLRGWLAPALRDDRLRVIVVGHTGVQGDAAANLELSARRAEHVKTVAEGLGIAADRIVTSGVGGGAPLARASGQSDRAYAAQLARVDVTLQVRR